MGELIRYILLVNVFLAILSLFFRLILQRENRHQLNRLFLTGGILLSLLVPLWQLDLVQSPDQALIVISEARIWDEGMRPDIILDEIEIVGEAPVVFPWMHLTQFAYLAGILFLSMVFFLKLSRIRDLQRACPMVWKRDLFISLLPKGSAPFSFLGIVYFPAPLDLHDETTQMILDHEQTHLREKHAWDQLLLEVLKIFFFYNPAVYLLQKQVSLTHEFLADARPGNKNPEKYSRVLVESFFQARWGLPAQAFKSSSSLKQRLIRLNHGPTGRWTSIKYLTVVPLWMVFVLLSSLTMVIP